MESGFSKTNLVYTREEAVSASTEYFDGDELASDVFVKKYALTDADGNLLEKTPDQMHRRIAKEFARIENKKFKEPLTEDNIFELLDHFKYIVPAGSPMFGIGNDAQIISLSNCFFLEIPEDSYSSILKVDEQIVNVCKRRGGVGVCIDKLRPNGTRTNNAAKTSTGIVPFMERYSNSIREVGQENRRGAGICLLSVHHPQILDFATIKRDLTKVTGMNISVKLSDEFLQAVEKNKEYELRWPLEGEPKVSKMVSAKEVWDTIIESAWAMGEPGLLIWDNITRETPADAYEEYASKGCNPSLRKGTLVLTSEGPKEIQDLENQTFQVRNLENGLSDAKCRLSGKNKQLYAVELQTGMTYYCTKEHRWATNKGELTTDKLCSGHRLPITKKANIFHGDLGDFDDGFWIGWLLGDGWITNRSDNGRAQYGMICSSEDYKDGIAEYLIQIMEDKFGYVGKFRERQTSKNLFYEFSTCNSKIDDYLKKFYNPSKEQGISKRLICEASEEFICGIINGYFSADGGVYVKNKQSRISFSASSSRKKLLSDISEILGFFGIKSTLKNIKPRKITFPNGKDYNKTYSRIDLVINDLASKKHFANCFFSMSKHKENLLEIIKHTEFQLNVKPMDYVKVKNVYATDMYEDVWDIEVFDKHQCFSLSHCVTHNCSELNLSILDSCRLMSINLFSYVDNPFTKKAKFNYKKFDNHVQIAQRLMDDLVDLETEKIDKIIAKIKSDPEDIQIKKDELRLWKIIRKHNEEGRRTGLGITAMGDTIAAVGLKYGSNKSIEFAESIMRQMKLSAYRSSVNMAKEMSPFEGYSYDKEKDHPFIQRIKEEDESLFNLMKRYGRRNIALTTIAPTGSISILTRTSSGVEPTFQVRYTRRRKLNTDDTHVDFIDQSGDKWQEYEVLHPKFEMWQKITGKTKFEKSPWFGSLANDIDWTQRVKFQGRIQKHICHSISSTVNLPKNATKENVAQIYQTAWKNGLKGITVYREGSRSGVLINKENVGEREAPKRPKELPCEIYHTNISKKLDKIRHFQYMVIIGVMDDMPYEIFAIENGKHKSSSGQIVRKKRGHYDLILDSGDVIENFTKDTTEGEDALTRMVSTSLRHRVPINFICEQLNKVEGDLLCFAKSLSRSLKRFIKDGTKSSEECSECGAQLVYENGCFVCKSCGFSKCT